MGKDCRDSSNNRKEQKKAREFLFFSILSVLCVGQQFSLMPLIAGMEPFCEWVTTQMYGGKIIEVLLYSIY